MADRIARIWNGSSWEVITSTAAAPTAVANYQSSAPSNPVTGQIWIDSDNDSIYVWDGSSWIESSVDLSAYLTQSSASATYLTQSSASATYAPISSPSFLPAGGSASEVLTKTTSSDYDVSWQTPIMPIYAHGRTLANGTAVYLSGMSVSRSSAGVYVYTFDVTRSDTNFSVLATPAAAPGTDPNMFVHTFTNSGFTITVGVGDNSGNTDVSTDFAHSVVVLA